MEDYNLSDNELDIDEMAIFLSGYFRNNSNDMPNLFGVSNINFVFDTKTINEICDCIEKYKNTDYSTLRKWLLEINDKYTNDINKDFGDITDEDNQIYIKVNDYKKFFKLIQKIQKIKDKQYRYNKGVNGRDLIQSMWLRMGPSDLENVISFLERQIEFLENDNYFQTYMMHYGDTQNLRICYFNEDNQLWFETNKHICFYLGDVNNAVDSYDIKNGMYRLPAVHYGLSNENGELVCYIYGIQNLENDNQNIFATFSEETKNEIHSNKRKFGRLRISRDLPLALMYFLDLLEQNGITKIKVPTLQVFNYDYHIELSKNSASLFSKYTSEQITYYEEQIKKGIIGEDEIKYIGARDYYNRFYGKEDSISENKTERLIQIFSLVEEKLKNIEILRYSFEGGDEYMVIEIKPKGLDKYSVYGFEGHSR